MSVELTRHVEGHQPGTISVYQLTIDLRRQRGRPRTLYYIGQSARPDRRANQHKSEIRTCRVTTQVGKSALFSPRFLDGTVAIHLTVDVLQTGLSRRDARVVERALAQELRVLHGDAVLTKPTG